MATDNELARILKDWSENFPFEQLAKSNTDWTFIAPAAPHKGGIWEAAVKVLKMHLKAAIGCLPLTLLSLIQYAIQIEGCMNSRPLFAASDDPSDFRAITPADLFLGKPIHAQPLAEYVAQTPDNRLTWWQQKQKVNQTIWRHVQQTHYASLQVRSKWPTLEENMQVREMVLVMEENLPPTQWCIGRVVETFTDRDGVVRTVKVKTATTHLIRPITKLRVLPPPQQVVDPPSAAGGGEPEQNVSDEAMDSA